MHTLQTNQMSNGQAVQVPVPASSPKTMLFVGVSTSQSSAHQHFPGWITALGAPGTARLEGVDLPIGASSAQYREVVGRLRSEPDLAGALITSHKIAIHQAAADLLDSTDDLASACGEVGCISRATGRLVGHALDPVTSMAAFDHLTPAAHWQAFPEGQAVCLGAGGAGVAIGVGLARRIATGHGPAAIVFVDRDLVRVDHALTTVARFGAAEGWARGVVTGGNVAATDAVVSGLPPGSVVVNATGMGKDIPGSPLSDSVRFPDGGIAWDLNYRGDRPFLRQAAAQVSTRGLRVADGWDYFTISWALHVARVFGTPEDPETLGRAVQATIRP
jgi:shikimate dehydrogenase